MWRHGNTGSDNFDYTRKFFDTESDQEDESDGECWGIYGLDSDEEFMVYYKGQS